jgi:transposase
MDASSSRAATQASEVTYAEATASQKVQDFVLGHVHALSFFGGVPAMWVPDQLKSAVVVARRYEPGIQRTYAEFAGYYDSAVVPARPYKPRDKAKVEVAVQAVQRWILARLRNERFFSLEALNLRIRELLDELNDRPMKKLGGISRRELFERIERAALRPLPSAAYEYADWHKKTLNTDYHVEVDKHWYSAPFRLVHQEIWARVTSQTVELLRLGERVASHRRSGVPYKHATDPAHMPEAHRRHAAGPEGVLRWAESVGPIATAMVHTKRLLACLPRSQGGMIFPLKRWFEPGHPTPGRANSTSEHSQVLVGTQNGAVQRHLPVIGTVLLEQRLGARSALADDFGPSQAHGHLRKHLGSSIGIAVDQMKRPVMSLDKRESA